VSAAENALADDETPERGAGHEFVDVLQNVNWQALRRRRHCHASDSLESRKPALRVEKLTQLPLLIPVNTCKSRHSRHWAKTTAH
jgi:hypothetical protein